MEDIVIIGAGPVGALTALALQHRQSAHRLVLLDAAARGAAAYERTLALSYGSRLLLERVGVWAAISPAPQPIECIDVSQQNGIGHALIRATDCDVPALGYTLSYASLKAALDSALAQSGLRVRDGAKVERVCIDPTCASVHLETGQCIDAQLVVAADGGHVLLPGMRTFTRDHGHSAVVAHVQASAPRPTLAFERFTPQGPIALLPLNAQGRYGLVWTHPRAQAPQVVCVSTAQFEAKLQQAFGHELGTLTLLNAPTHYPLGLRYTEPRALPRRIAVGNAAQAMHPIAAQGLNLGFRDAWALAEQLAALPAAQLGGWALSLKFGCARVRDRLGGVLMTETLVSVFGWEHRLANTARGLGLAAFDALAPLKRRVAQRMMFGA